MQGDTCPTTGMRLADIDRLKPPQKVMVGDPEGSIVGPLVPSVLVELCDQSRVPDIGMFGKTTCK